MKTFTKKHLLMKTITYGNIFPRDFEILGWCPAGPVSPHGEKVPL